MDYTHKKIPIITILSSSMFLVHSYLVKGYDLKSLSLARALVRRGLEVPLNLYQVDYFFFRINFSLVLLIYLLILGFGIYTLMYKQDEEIKLWIRNKRTIVKSSNRFNRTNNDNLSDAKKSQGLNKYWKKTTSYFPLIIICGVLIFFAIYIKGIKDLERPLSLFESIVSGFGSNFLIVFAIMITVYIGQKIMGSKN